jgi:hypothetical protein
VKGIGELILGDFYDGDLRAANLTLEFRPSRHVFLALQYEQNDGRLGAGDFTQRLARIRFNLAFTPEISWTNVVQYETVTDDIGLNSIFRWEIESGREFYVVLNHNWLEQYGRFRSRHSDFGVKLRWTFRF